MAKGNLFQGMGRGKVGDVVFSRLNGEQLSRVRNRNPKNPNTNKQLYQRAIMATVMQAYSAGIVIFDHAFQGREIGAANQRRFISLNAKLLRSQVATDIKGGVALEDQQGRVVAPGVSSPVAAALQVSEGTLRNVLFGSTVPEPLTDETVGAYCTRIGLVVGDLFTFVAFKNDSASEVLFSVNGIDSNLAKQYKTQFLFARYAVKESAISDTTTAFANLGQVLELTDSNFTPLVDFSTFDGGEEAPAMQTMCGQDAYGTYGWIRSRRNSDLRSKCILSFDSANTGIASQYALQAWSQGTANLGDSDLILEGGGGVEPVEPTSLKITSNEFFDITNEESEFYGKKAVKSTLNDNRVGVIYVTCADSFYSHICLFLLSRDGETVYIDQDNYEEGSSDELTIMANTCNAELINLGDFANYATAEAYINSLM